MISITPETFTKVDFDAERIAEIAAASMVEVLGPGAKEDLGVHVDELQATSRIRIGSLDPLAFHVDSGALEEYKQPRELGGLESRITFTRLFLEVADRRNPDFGAPGLDDEVTLATKMAWDVNLYGRVARMGLRLHQPRFRYNFRNRHGFSDLADRIFDELWDGGDLTWRRISEMSERATDHVITDLP